VEKSPAPPSCGGFNGQKKCNLWDLWVVFSREKGFLQMLILNSRARFIAASQLFLEAAPLRAETEIK
jgi:hypothetical protein